MAPETGPVAGSSLVSGVSDCSGSSFLVFFFFAAYSWGGVAGLGAFLIVLGMWIGAIYGRYHYLTDVLIGILLGILSIIAAFLFIR